jgi:hypothetical protein
MQLTIVYNVFDNKQANLALVTPISRKGRVRRFSVFWPCRFLFQHHTHRHEIARKCVTHSYRTPDNTIEKWVLSSGEDCMKLRHSASA